MCIARHAVMNLPVDATFTRALPKIELHAHLTGSISLQCLHDIWARKRDSNLTAGLDDPLIACRPEGAHHDILSFFPIFDTYIYHLCNDKDTVALATWEVLKAFEADGVRYLELRTTPREALMTGLSKETYVKTVLETLERHGRGPMSTYLILSIDRRNTLEQAIAVVELATKYKDRGIVGIDLCGNPLRGDVSIFRDAFALAKQNGLRVTIHFGEVPQSSSDLELQTLLSYQPDRIGHVVNVTPEVERTIEQRRLGLELCLSCNVHAKMTKGGFKGHHFGKWLHRDCPIVLCTDDVGVFGSPLSNEYLLAAQNFDLERTDLIELCRRAVLVIFGGSDEQHRLLGLLDAFQNESRELETTTPLTVS